MWWKRVCHEKMLFSMRIYVDCSYFSLVSLDRNGVFRWCCVYVSYVFFCLVDFISFSFFIVVLLYINLFARLSFFGIVECGGIENHLIVVISCRHFVSVLSIYLKKYIVFYSQPNWIIIKMLSLWLLLSLLLLLLLLSLYPQRLNRDLYISM